MTPVNRQDQPQTVSHLRVEHQDSAGFSSESLVSSMDQVNLSSQQVNEPERRQLSTGEQIIIDEIEKCLINWYQPWKQSFLDGGSKFGCVYELMEGLLHYEKQIIHSSDELSSERLKLIAKAVARLIDYGNAILEIDMAIRSNDESFRELDPTSMTTIELYKAHIEAYKLRRKLLDNYFKMKNQQESSETDNQDASGSSPTSTLRVPNLIAGTFPPSPTFDRSHRFSVGSNTSINTLNLATNPQSDGRRTPQQSLMSYIEVKTMSSTEDLSESQLEMRHMIATLRSKAFTNPKDKNTRHTLLLAALAKVDSLLTMPATIEKLTNCFELLDTLFDTVERLPPESRQEEVQMMASSVLKTLVRKVYIDDRDSCVEFQHSHWTTYLLSIIRMMSAPDYDAYLRTFSNTPELGRFLIDYLFIIKRLFSSRSKADDTLLNLESEPVYPDCWIEMNLLVYSIFLKSLMYLFQVMHQFFGSNAQMWLSYLDCLLHLILQDVLQHDRPMLKGRQKLMAEDLRRTTAGYVRITWDSLSPEQQYQSIEEVIEPLLMACMKLNSRDRSVLLPIFYDMMRCDYEDQYVGQVGTVCTINEESFLNQTNPGSYIPFEDKLEIRNAAHDHHTDELFLNPPKMQHENSEESLPYLSFCDQRSNHNQSNSDDGTVLTKFTHLIIGRLHKLINNQDLGDDQFGMELCSTMAGNEFSGKDCFQRSNDLRVSDRFKSMAKHTSELVGEFIQICLDLREANKMSYNHLRLLCLFKLILFFRDKVDEIELYLTNLNKLWRLHHAANRYVEAGFTLLEHAKSLPWTNKPLENHYRIITRSFQSPVTDYMSLKLSLYTAIIEYFDQGQLWEAAVPLCRELIDIYQFRLYDYERLSQILVRLSNFFSDISNGHKRSYPEYFRVSFYGIGFPACLQNSTMIYRGKAYEKLSDFSATLLSKYPDARLLKTLNPPDEDLMMEPDAKYLQVNACSPVVDLKSKFKSISDQTSTTTMGETTSIDINDLQESILSHYKYNECDKFEYSRRIDSPSARPATTDATVNHRGGDEFANMWRQRITLTTNTLPGMLPFFPVFLTETSIISPIECAIDDVARTNDRLASMVNRFKADKHQTEDIRQLGQLLLGIVDAAVNGGITKYEKAFFEGNYTNTSTPSIRLRQSDANKSPLTTKTGLSPCGDQTQAPHPPPLPLSPPPQLNNARTPKSTAACRSTRLFMLDPNVSTPNSDSKLELSPNNGANELAETNSDALKAAQQKRQLHQPSTSQMEKLKSLIARQVPLLEEGIRLHRERVADVMRPQHDHMENSFNRLKDHVLSKYHRYLSKSDYHRSMGTTRSFRTSFARSPNRSTRSESRISLVLSANSSVAQPAAPVSDQAAAISYPSPVNTESSAGRFGHKRLSDACSYSSLAIRSSCQRQALEKGSVGDSNASESKKCNDDDDDDDNDEETNFVSSAIPYKQLT